MTVSQEECRSFALSYADQLLEDYRLWDAGLVATESGWFVCRSLRRAKTARRWAPSEIRWECGHAGYSFYSGSLEDCPDDGVSVPTLHAETLLIDGSSKSWLWPFGRVHTA
jgi:hypothetical protein